MVETIVIGKFFGLGVNSCGNYYRGMCICGIGNVAMITIRYQKQLVTSINGKMDYIDHNLAGECLIRFSFRSVDRFMCVICISKCNCFFNLILPIVS